MKRNPGGLAALIFTFFLLAGFFAIGRGSLSSQAPVGSNSFPHKPSSSTHAQEAPIQPIQAPSATRFSQAMAQSLRSLQKMQRSLALADHSFAHESPNLALLTADVTTAGLGPIRIGMSIDEVEAEGIALTSIQNLQRGACQYYQVRDSLEPVVFMVIDNRIIRIDVGLGSIIETRSGLKIGSSEADVYDTYPGRIETAPNPFTQGQFLVFTPEDPTEAIFRLVFETDASGKVVRYRTGQFPAVTWAEGCL